MTWPSILQSQPVPGPFPLATWYLDAGTVSTNVCALTRAIEAVGLLAP